jgi:hypothetical protein
MKLLKKDWEVKEKQRTIILNIVLSKMKFY